MNVLLKQDLEKWCIWKSEKFGLYGFTKFFLKYPEFRRLVDFRLKDMGPFKFFRIFTYFSSRGHKLFIKGKISGGLLLQHAFCTIILCKQMGHDCKVMHQVTIGMRNGKIPSIGNNVTFGAGCKVLGGITIGDDVIIGANAVVLRNVPSHSIVAGVPASIIKTRDINGNWVRVDVKKQSF